MLDAARRLSTHPRIARTVPFTIALCLIVVLGLAALHGAQQRRAASAKAAVIVVDGIAVSTVAWQQAVVLAQHASPAPASLHAVHQIVLHNIVQRLAAVHAARLLGMTVKDSDVDDFTTQQQVSASPQVAAYILNVQHWLGVTPQQFWALQRDSYSDALLINQLHAHYQAQVRLHTPALPSPRLWDRYLDSLASHAEVRILNPSLVE